MNRLFDELRPGRPTYPVGNPGGEARDLADDAIGELAEPLAPAPSTRPSVGS